MAIFKKYDQVSLTAGGPAEVLVQVSGFIVGVILENQGTGIVHYTFDTTTPSKTVGARLHASQEKIFGADLGEVIQGESFLKTGMQGIYVEPGPEAGGSDGTVAVINVVIFSTIDLS